MTDEETVSSPWLSYSSPQSIISLPILSLPQHKIVVNVHHKHPASNEKPEEEEEGGCDRELMHDWNS